MDNEDYITNIHAYWRHGQKSLSAKQPENAAASLPLKTPRSKSSAAHSHPSKSTSQPHGGHNQYLDYGDYQSDDDDGGGDNEDKNTRFKGKNSRKPQDQWYDECDKVPRHKGKNRKDQSYEDYEDCWDYDIDDCDWDYHDGD